MIDALNPHAMLLAACSIGLQIMTMSVVTQDRFREASGKTELLRVCGECHEPEVVFAYPQTAGEWSETLSNMAQQGARASNAEWRLIEKYLDAQLAIIPINTAPAAEVQATFDVPAPVAQAVVKYRQTNGDFKSIEDVKKVPGLETASVDARKDRLVF
jgi:competence protein ComEA